MRFGSLVLVVASVAASCSSSDSQEFVFVDANDVGDDPFTPDIAEVQPAEFIEIVDQTEDIRDNITTADGVVDPERRAVEEVRLVDRLRQEGAPVTRSSSRDGVGLYGGSGVNACDKEQLIDFLLENPEKGVAFADVQGIDVSDIPSYIDSLTDGFLLLPTTVTNHGFKDGQASPIPNTTLEEGTAVLVDGEGVPRVRCKCGNPLLPAAVNVASAYPDELILYPSITQEPEAYPIGLPPAVRLTFGPPTPLTQDEIDNLIVIEDGVRRSVTLTIADGPAVGTEFDFGDVAVPTAWRQEDLDSGDLVSWSNLSASSAETAFIAPGTPVADIRVAGGRTYAGYRVGSPGTFSIRFPFQGDGSGGLLGVGLELQWTGDMECVLTIEEEFDGFVPADNCPDKSDDMFWDWGVNTITFG